MKDDFERRLYVADFETVVEADPTTQEKTEVWWAGLCPVLERPEPEHVRDWNNIYEFIEALSLLEDNAIVFFHNERFDGSYLLNCLDDLGFIPAMSWEDENHYAPKWQQNMMSDTYSCLVSSMGEWYSIRIRFDDRTIEIRDSAKKLPMTLEDIGKNFDTKYKKLTMQYENDENVHHRAFGNITEEEREYAFHDLLVLSEAMWIIWYKYNMHGITIASDALREYKELMGPEYDELFPNVHDVYIDELGGDEHISVHDYCHAAYSGGWCWKNPNCDKKVYKSDIEYPEEIQKEFDKLIKDEEEVIHVKNIMVADVNSLYPSNMHSESGNYYPVGVPEYHKGQPLKSEIKKRAIIRRFECRFKKKKGKVPFIHIRHSRFYDANECLTTSDIKGSRYYKTSDGVEHDTLRTYTMTQAEFELFQECYDILNYKPIDYLSFERKVGIFDKYIDKYREMKIEATKTGNKAMRQIAKLYMNSLYGRISTSKNSSFKTIRFDDHVMKFTTIEEYNKTPVFMPAGAYITAWSRRFTITAANKNFYEGEDKGTQYSDTDSLHLVNLNPDEIIGIPIHPSAFCHWALEESSCAFSTWAKQKTYVEIATAEDGKTVTKSKEDKTPWFNVIVKAAGLGKQGKQTFVDHLFMERDEPGKVYLEDFRSGLKIKACNLKAKQIKGGVLLVPSDFKIS